MADAYVHGTVPRALTSLTPIPALVTNCYLRSSRVLVPCCISRCAVTPLPPPPSRQPLPTSPHLPAPHDCTRLLLLGDILAAADYPLDRLYIEYVVRWDPETWDLLTPWPQQEPGIVQVGVCNWSPGLALQVAHRVQRVRPGWMGSRSGCSLTATVAGPPGGV